MPNTKKTLDARKKAGKKSSSQKIPVRKSSIVAHLWGRVAESRVAVLWKTRMRNFLSRRPHRSFRRTYRRDYVRSLNLPGYITFTHQVSSILWRNKKVFFYLALTYAAMTVVLVNLSSEDLYSQMRTALTETGDETFEGFWGEVGKAGLLLLAGASGGFNEAAADSPAQVFAVIVGLLSWLTTVWLLRVILAGRKPKLRDGLYNAGAPIVPTMLIATIIIVQLLPIAVAVFGYGAAVASGLLDGGVEAMMFWSVAALLVILSLYWITTTIIAFIVVTLPGMYPMQALRTAGDLVVGRRVRILLRLLWMGLVVVVVWAVIMIPVIMFDGWLKSAWSDISWLPLVPISLMMMASLSTVWIASYVYLLYRRIVEDDALPA